MPAEDDRVGIELASASVDMEDGDSIVSDWAELESVTLLVILSDSLITPISLLLSVSWYVSEVLLVPSAVDDSDNEESPVSEGIVGDVAV